METKKITALSRLSKLDLADRRRAYPTVPEHAVAKATFSDTTANGLTKCILRYLQLQRHEAWRQASEGRYRPGQRITDVIGRSRQIGGQWLPGQNKGASDVAAIIRGRFCAIEVKMKDKQSDAQKEYQKRIEASGGLYTIVRSFAEFLDWYQNLNNHKHEPTRH